MLSENLWSNLITVGVLFAIFIIAYCKITNKTLTELIKEIMEIFKPETIGG